MQVVHDAFAIRTAVTKLAENRFYMSETKIDTVISNALKFVDDPDKKLAMEKKMHQYFDTQVSRITERALDFACNIANHLQIANTIFPNYMSEWEERRVELDRAMGCCNALQSELQYAGECLYADLNKYTKLVLEIQKEFNMIKSLRQADNRFLKTIQK